VAGLGIACAGLVASSPVGAVDLLPHLPTEMSDYHLTVNTADWNWLLQNPTTDETIPATFRFRNDIIQADIRFRGAPSHRLIAEKSFKVYLEGDYRIDGHSTLNLNHGRGGLPFFLENLGYDIYRALGYPVSRTEPVRLFLNGEFMGVFTRIEPIDGSMLRRPENFGVHDGGSVYKGIDHLRYWGEDPSPYHTFYEKKRNMELDEWDDVIRLCYLLDEAPYDEFAREISKVLDIDHHIEWYAIETVIAAIDNWCCGNYYLYQHPEIGRFIRIPWDYNGACFLHPDASIRGAHLERDPPPTHLDEYTGPLSRVLEIPLVWERYRIRVAELMDQVLVERDWEEALVRLRALVWDDFRVHNANMGRDPDYQVEYSPERLTGFVAPRRAAITQQLQEMKPPDILSFDWDYDLWRDRPSLQLTARIADPTRLDSIVVEVLLDDSLRVTLPLRDDGESGDEVAADGIFGGMLEISASDARFYLYTRSTDRLVAVAPGIDADMARVGLRNPLPASTIAPNPFLSSQAADGIRIQVKLAGAFDPTTTFDVFDVAGRRVASLPARLATPDRAVVSLSTSGARALLSPAVYYVRYGSIRVGRLVVLE